MTVPIGLRALAGLYLLYAGFFIWIALHGILSVLYALFGLIILGVGLCFIALARALCRLKRWAWYGSVTLSCLSVLSFLFALLKLNPQHDVIYTRVFQGTQVAINFLIILYLSRTRIRSRFFRIER